jgi:hypothetical protein
LPLGYTLSSAIAHGGPDEGEEALPVGERESLVPVNRIPDIEALQAMAQQALVAAAAQVTAQGGHAIGSAEIIALRTVLIGAAETWYNENVLPHLRNEPEEEEEEE